MKRAILSLFALSLACIPRLGGGFTNVPGTLVIWQETQAGTRAAPTLSTEGMPLGYTSSLHEVVQCSDGSNVTAGSEIGWQYSTTLGADGGLIGWSLASTSNTWTLPTGKPNAVSPEFTVSTPFGRWLWANSGVTCAGGSWDGGTLNTIESNHLP